MKILLVYPNANGVYGIPLGLAYISSTLKQEGHETILFDTTPGLDKKDLLSKCRGVDLACVSVQSLFKSQAFEISQLLKDRYDIPIIWGGVHPTACPNECINYGCVDVVCVGEGEHAMLELAGIMESGCGYSGVSNFWLKEGGRLIKNPVRPLIKNLDDLPYPDRDLFDARHLRINTGSNFISSRGCPFSCSYCINSTLHHIYPQTNFLRRRSVDNLVEEIEFVTNKYGLTRLIFVDDTFTLDRRWLEEFSEKYPMKVGLPFEVHTRCDTIDNHKLKMLKTAGCDQIDMGVESGNEWVRRQILKRSMSDETIIKAFGSTKKMGFRTHSFNMIGFPGETEEQILDTIKLNKKISADSTQLSVFYPFPGTDLRRICEEKGLIDGLKDDAISYYHDSVLALPEEERLNIKIYHKFWAFFLLMPVIVFPLAKVVFRNLLKAAYFLQSKTNSKKLMNFLDNLYFITYAMTNKKFLFYSLPYSLKKLFK